MSDRQVSRADTGRDQRSRGKQVLRILVIIAIVVFVFGWLLPQFIDYELVWEAISGLSWTDLLLLCLLSALRIPSEAVIYRTMLPGLRLWPGSEAYLSSNVAANVLPPPAPSVIQYAYFRAEGFDARVAATGALGSFIFPQGARIVLPIVAFVVLLAAGSVDTEALVITGVSVALVLVIGVLVWLIGRSESSARWVGAKLGRMASWVMTKAGRDPIGDLGDQVVEFRDNAYAVIRERWLFGSMAVSANLLLTYLILLVSLRSVGIGSSELDPVAIFASFAVAFFAGVVIPISGSGLGVVDIVMVSALSASAAGSVDVNIIVAAVVLWRVFYGLLAFFPGIITLTRFSRANRDLLQDASTELGTEFDADLDA